MAADLNLPYFETSSVSYYVCTVHYLKTLTIDGWMDGWMIRIRHHVWLMIDGIILYFMHVQVVIIIMCRAVCDSCHTLLIDFTSVIVCLSVCCSIRRTTRQWMSHSSIWPRSSIRSKQQRQQPVTFLLLKYFYHSLNLCLILFITVITESRYLATVASGGGVIGGGQMITDQASAATTTTQYHRTS